jgi:hypothetical protein
VLKYGGNKIVTQFTKLCWKIKQGEKIQEEIKPGYISSIYKKGDRKVFSNYGSIFLCVRTLVMKVFGRLLKHLFQNKYINAGKECGFTKGGSYVDHIYNLRQILKEKD